MSTHDSFLMAFERDLQRAAPHPLDHYVDLYWSDRASFESAEQQAWASSRPEPFISMAQVRALNQPLEGDGARRLVRRLIESRRFGEAIQVLQEPHWRRQPDRSWLLELAWAEVGLGRLDRATVALEEACAGAETEGDGQIKRLRAAVTALGRLQAAAGEAGRWEETQALVERWLKLGSGRGAFQAVVQFLQAGGTLDQRQRLQFLATLQTIFSLHRPVSPANLFRSIGSVLNTSARRRVLAEICTALAGDAAAEDLEHTEYAALRAAGALALAGQGRLEEAIRVLAALTHAYPGNEHFRPRLDRMVGQRVLAEHRLRYRPGAGRPEIFDVFPFNNELRLLKVKLEEMAGWVDHFVLVEARQTFTGQPKPLVFEQNRDAFAAFAGKIIHVVVDEFPEYLRHPWAREFYQRNMGVLGLTGRCREDDFVIISDADEVIRGEVVRGFDGECARLGMERLQYFLNYRKVVSGDALPVCASLWRARYLRTLGLSYLRDTVRYHKASPRLNDAGWHFTSIGDAQAVAAKLKTGSHQDFASIPAEALEAILTEVRAGRYEEGWERCELAGYPSWIRGHTEQFADVLL